ncbi:unnamed protein product [Protopolystoma xenopodis]|uniref:Uncharacterized protein n=1 Tax=Protopolystoma xenopodis TaxID=117903 RepID=A0A448WD24_9PLAT|nr:unnamed protein product [Protopolystoma xenopodis]
MVPPQQLHQPARISPMIIVWPGSCYEEEMQKHKGDKQQMGTCREIDLLCFCNLLSTKSIQFDLLFASPLAIWYQFMFISPHLLTCFPSPTGTTHLNDTIFMKKPFFYVFSSEVYSTKFLFYRLLV